jgi:hypothetical protein
MMVGKMVGKMASLMADLKADLKGAKTVAAMAVRWVANSAESWV